MKKIYKHPFIDVFYEQNGMSVLTASNDYDFFDSDWVDED